MTKRTPAPTPTPTPPPTPPPTPRPTPKITPTPPPRPTLAPVVAVRAPAAKAAATPARHLGGAAAPKHVVHATPPPRKAPARVVSLVEGKARGRQNGGSGTGAGAGAGTGGLGGTGSGSGTAGNGNGSDASSACGDVYLEPSHLSYRRDGTVVQEVIAKVTTRDGNVQIGKFPWPFLYPGEKDNPFVHDEALGPHNGVPVQQPPPGTDLSNLPPAVAYVMKYTDPATGETKLPAC